RALEMCRPYGVDVSSGVEKEPGVKDPDLLWQFISKVRQFAYER
ncbi:MAG TPA: phosphoribosylanthranilate isomerase, partial [Limnochordia bacterium]|nr:phosphoribosylanthranilate isomerase [Limnochordia bacterium]